MGVSGLSLAAVLVGAAALDASAADRRARRGADYVWWEGEAALETNFSNRSWFHPKRLPRRAGLSGGDWLNNGGVRRGAELFARYRVVVPAAGTYHLWTRKFWKHGPFRWRFDGEPWRVCGRDIALADTFVLRPNVCANWVHLGEVRLSRGVHRFELRLLAGEGQNATACFDAFLLVRGQFIPRGKLKPGERAGGAEPGWWAFDPPADPFGEALLDLRSLNEGTAGESGFVRRDGDRLVLGNGKPVRFWGVNVGPGVVRLDHASLDYLARRLAKAGVNLVRFHGPVFDRRADDPAALDRALLDRIHYLAAALKKQGIYLELSFYFPLWFQVRRSYGIPGYETIQNKHPFALLFFDGRMQEIHRAWARALLTANNPYTGVPLARDPALALVEIVNEDSFFFWTFSERNVPPVQMGRLARLFGNWLAKKYGSVERALAAWGEGSRKKGDDPAAGRAAVLGAWHLTAKGHGTGPKRRRMRDQLQFLTELQRRFYQDTVRFLRRDLGVRSLVVCSNWKTADPVLLDPLERYTCTAGDVIDRHGYFGGRHRGPRARYAVSAGDTYTDRSALLEPQRLPIAFVQVAGYPSIVSELGWTNPNRFKAECPLLVAAYGALAGVDGYAFFALHGPGWEYWPEKFPLAVPTLMGQFPAAALLYRRGDVLQAGPVFRERLRLEDLYGFGGSAAVAPAGLDALRRGAVPPAGAGVEAAGRTRRIDPLAFYVGPVLRAVCPGAPSTAARDLAPFIDREKGIVKSADGFLAWDFRRGLFTLNTPRTQGAVGFLARAGRIELADLAVESRNEFAALVVTALDGLPIARSRRILVQAVTEEKPRGWRVENQALLPKVYRLGGSGVSS